MVADDDFEALAARILHLVDGLDAAVQRDDQGEAAVRRPVDALVGHAVTLVVTVGDIEIHPVGKTLDKGIDECDGRGAVHIVVAIDEDLLTRGDGLVQPLHGHVHVLHQEGIVEGFQAGPEERTRLLEGLDAPLDEELGEHPVDAHLRRKPLDLLRVGRFLEYPFAFFRHIIQI